MKIFSTFTGIGAFELALQNLQIDYEIIGWSEIDKYASSVYERHHPGSTNYGDITRIRSSDIPDFDLLIGGSPCQSFSAAGRRGGAR